MKVLITLLLLQGCVCAQDRLREFTVTVQFSSDAEGKMVYLRYAYADCAGTTGVDSAKVFSHQVVFRGSVCQPAPARVVDNLITLSPDLTGMMTPEVSLQFPGGNMDDPFEFFLMPGETTIEADMFLSESAIKGPLPVMDFERLKQAQSARDTVLIGLYEKLIPCLKRLDTQCVKQMEKAAEKEEIKLRGVFLNYYENHLHSPLALYALKNSIPRGVDSPAVYLRQLERLSATVKAYPEARAFKKSLEGARDSRPGIAVKDFEQADSAGNRVGFTSFAGSFVLIYFWNSSSLEMYAANALVLPVWKKYQDRGLRIVGIALETPQSRGKWLDVLKVYKTPWPQLTDFEDFSNVAARQFGVISLPYYVLIDKEQRIIWKSASLGEMERVLLKEIK